MHSIQQVHMLIAACICNPYIQHVNYSTEKDGAYKSGVEFPNRPERPAYTKWLESMDFT